MSEKGPAADVEIVRDVVYGDGGGRPLHMHVLRPSPRPTEPLPCIVIIHGGAWRMGSRDSTVDRLAALVRRGYVGAAIEYRFSQEAIFPAQIHDAKCAIRFLRANASDLGIIPFRIGVWGASAGGHLAALLGTSVGVAELEGEGGYPDVSSEIQAVCDWFGATDFLRMDQAGDHQNHNAADSPESQLIGGPIQEHPDLVARANPITYVDGNEPPFLIVHGTRDTVVPLEQSTLLADALQHPGADLTLEVLPDAGHGGPDFDTPRVEELVAAFFERTLKSES
jgi:acetyl esterase/lipase